MWRNLTAGQWREDLDVLVDAVQREHVDLHHTVSASRFRSASRSLRGRLPSLAGHAVSAAQPSLRSKNTEQHIDG